MGNQDLTKRHKSEIDFHDKKYASRKKETIYDLGFTDLIFNEMLARMGNIEGKKVVDFGCGNGWLTEILLEKGAEVWAFDISSEAVVKTARIGEKLNLSSHLHTDVMPAESLAYEDGYFDLIVGIGILHHLELKIASKEIQRVLKKGGTAYFMEPLGYNPLINLYRKTTPDIRSVDEKPLLADDLLLLDKVFTRFDHREYYLFTLSALFWYYGIRNERLMIATRNLMFSFDKLVLSCLPFLKKLCWYSILIMHK